MKTTFLKSLLCAGLVCLAGAASAQTAEKRVGVGFNLGFREYRGDLGDGLFQYKDPHPIVGLDLGYYLNPGLDLVFRGNGGLLNFKGSYNNAPRSFESTVYDFSLGFRLKLYSDAILKEDAFIGPYLYAGFSGINSSSDNSQTRFDIGVPAGLGIRFRFSETINLRVQSTYNFTFADELDGVVDDTQAGKGNDDYLHHSIGLVFNLGKGKIKDDDMDGVANRDDKCPDTKTGYKVDAKGCPLDSDTDGIVDSEDTCPQQAGIARFQGCPDTDGDGVADATDSCPTTPGLTQFAGCPDTDADGVTDASDRCPTVKGVALFNGCPDSDADGVQDSEDRCPTEAGDVSNGGCPRREVSVVVIEQAKKAAQGILFETGKDVIRTVSYPKLDVVVRFMKEDPTLKVDIEGHTDNVGNDATNLSLSNRRAAAVKAYLVRQGISADRLVSQGFGETKPIATNDTPAGRTRNRRVEFKLYY